MADILVRAGCYVSIIILGYVLRRVGFFGPETFGVLAKIVLKITLPAAIITTSAGRTLDAGLLSIVLLSLAASAVYMAVGYLLNRKNGRGAQGFAIINFPGYNIGTFALPFTQSFLGPMGVIATNLFDVGNSFICLGGSYCIASSVKDGTGFSLKRIAKSAVTSVALMTHFLMVALNLAGLTLPKSILSLAELIGSANSVLAMLMLGVGMNLSGGSSRMRYIAKHLAIRYSMAAVFAAAFYFLLPFALEVRRALVILAFSPFASATPVFTEELREDRELSATINSFSVVCSIIIIIGLLMLML